MNEVSDATVLDQEETTEMVIRPRVQPAIADIVKFLLSLAFIVFMWNASRDSYVIWQVAYPLIGAVPVILTADRLWSYFRQRLTVSAGVVTVRGEYGSLFVADRHDIRSPALGTEVRNSRWRMLPPRYWYPILCTANKAVELRFLTSSSRERAHRDCDRLSGVLGGTVPLSEEDRIFSANNSAWTTLDALPPPANRTDLSADDVPFYRTRVFFLLSFLLFQPLTIYLAYSGDMYSRRSHGVYVVPEPQRSLVGFIATVNVIVSLLLLVKSLHDGT